MIATPPLHTGYPWVSYCDQLHHTGAQGTNPCSRDSVCLTGNPTELGKKFYEVMHTHMRYVLIKCMTDVVTIC